jgi:hypothetical protein
MRRRARSLVVASAVLCALLATFPAARADPSSAAAAGLSATATLDSQAAPATCRHPSVPDWFHDSLVTSIRISKDLHPDWADSPSIARIICWQGSDFDVGYAPPGDDFHAFHGVFAMTLEELA